MVYLTVNFDYLYMAPKEWTNEFTQCAYKFTSWLSSPQVLIQYIGDETKAGQFPQGNSTKSCHNFTCTQPSVISSVKDAATGTVSAQCVYQTLVVSGSASTAPVTAMPRNTQQVKNTLKVMCNRNPLTCNALLTRISIISRSVSSVCNKLDTSVVFQRKRESEPEDDDTDESKKARTEADEGASARDQRSERLVLYVVFVSDIKQYLLREQTSCEQTEVKLG